MTDYPPDQSPGEPEEQPFVAPSPGYGEQLQQSNSPPPQPADQYPSQQPPYGLQAPYGQQPPYGLQPPLYYQPGPPARSSHRTRNIVLGVSGALVFVGGLGVVVGLLIGAKNTPTASSTTTPPTASASSLAGSLSAYTWYTRDVNPTVTKLTGDYNRLRTDGNNNNDPAILADCQQMLSDAQTAQSEPAVADPTLENDWTKVLGDFSAGASDCVGSVKNGDSSLADRAKAEFLQANTDAGKLVSDLEKLANGS